MDTSSYLYLVLLPVAEVFRPEFPKGKAKFSAMRNMKSCRIKFEGKRIEKDWQKFCLEHELKNDSTLEY